MSELPYSKFKTFIFVVLFGSAAVALGLKELNKHKRLSSGPRTTELSFVEGHQLVNALHGVIDPSKDTGTHASTDLAPSRPPSLSSIISSDSSKAQLARDPKLLESEDKKNTDQPQKNSIFNRIKRLFSK